MRVEKRQKYIDNLKAGIHTLAGKADSVDEAAAAEEDSIKSCSKKKVRGQDRQEYYLQLNPNKAAPDGKMLRHYSDFEAVMVSILTSIGSTDFRITRADLAVDSENPHDFQLFQKLNKLLIACVADSEQIRNCYVSKDLWTNQSLSVAVKNDMIEMENYDKARESDNKSEVTNRLELRSKRISRQLDEEFLTKWFLRLDRAADRFVSVQERFNQELFALWTEDQKKPEKARDYMNITAFIMQYKDCIFTRRQLENLFEMVGSENPAKKAKNFKDRHTIEFFSKTDLLVIINGIKKTIIEYFEN